VVSSALDPSIAVYEARAGELADCLAVRRRVFIEGQSIPEELEVDGLDAQAAHFIARRGGVALGTARLRALDSDAKVERVAVLEEERGAGLGRVLMQFVEDWARSAGFVRLILSAQEPVLEFYARLGYRAEGERFFEAGIAHRKMSKKL
jgi:predicted GNAT family N-acyltransferase